MKLIMIEPMLDIAFSVLRALSRTHRLIYGCNLAEKIELLLSMYLSHLLALNNELCFYAVLFSFVYFQSNGTFVGFGSNALCIDVHARLHSALHRYSTASCVESYTF